MSQDLTDSTEWSVMSSPLAESPPQRIVDNAVTGGPTA
jgi:hypothetical protein